MVGFSAVITVAWRENTLIRQNVEMHSRVKIADALSEFILATAEHAIR